MRASRKAMRSSCNAARRLFLTAVIASSNSVVGAEPALFIKKDIASVSKDLTLSLDALEASGAVIGSVTIKNGSIFDLQNPEENKFLYRFANRAHVTTRPNVIEQQLLFATGEAFSSQALQESERILRGNRYIQRVQIEPVRHADGVVDIDVSTMDTWTLAPKLSYSRAGGKSSSGVGIKEMNLFGTGIGVGLAYKSEFERDSKVLKFVDRHIGDSWYTLRGIYESSTDGFTRFVEFGKPFYSMRSTSAYGVASFDNERIDSVYDHGEVVAQYGHRSKRHELYAGWSKGLQDGWAKRYIAGVGLDEHHFSEAVDGIAPTIFMPEDRKLFYPFVGIEWVQDKFEKLTNFDQIKRVEDRFLGTRFSARLGVAGSRLGSDRDAWLLNAGAQTSISKTKDSTYFLSSKVGARWENGGVSNLAIAIDAKYYKRQSDKRLFFARLSGTYGHALDLDQQLYLGGDNGLRGYPLRYQSGDKSALLTLEQRFFTDWYPFRLFRIGAAVFFDAGRTWGENPYGSANDGLLRDIGAGLRLGNSRSGLGRMIHVDVAYPLDGDDSISNVQFFVALKQSF